MLTLDIAAYNKIFSQIKNDSINFIKEDDKYDDLLKIA
jgi:hypothetical protein